MNLKTKKIISSILIAANLAMPANITLAKEESSHHKEVKVYFNDEQIEFDQQPIIVDGRTKVPFRAIFETIGTVVYYRESDKSIIGLSRDGDVIKHTVGTNKATINGVEKTYDSISETRNYRTLIPVRMVADLLNAEVKWNEKKKEVDIEKDIVTNEYHKQIKKILECTLDQNFNPEDFKRYLEYQSKHWSMDPKQVVIDVNMDLDRELIPVVSDGNFLEHYNNVASVVHNPSIIGKIHYEAKPEHIEVVNNPDDPLVLINHFNRLPENYMVPNLKDVHSEEWQKFYLSIGSLMYSVYLRDIAEKDYIDFIFAYSDYIEKTYNVDQGLLSVQVAFPSIYEEGYADNTNLRSENWRKLVQNCTKEQNEEWFAFNYSAPRYFNDFSTGYSITFMGFESAYIPIYEKYGYVYTGKEYDWRVENSYKYGFVVRYPQGKEHITRKPYQPWHYRYVGKEVAKRMHDENLCLEEYCAKYVNSSGYVTDKESIKKKILERY